MKSAPKNGQRSNYHEAWYTYGTGTGEYGDPKSTVKNSNDCVI